ncbi:AHH domain-containing protein [Arthrobacter cavernae]|uniref:DDE-type integrase/transposase/recombinase n=1 Tax=Arthrobacter cavernae TaxID=2817681 RepID=A0A939KPV8_9MICC|nr:AHH domain-containing protein [Arthrobacter cavernae]MBO1269295.1 DDE-type integrase/transposase/recombinase [Arthrobacter cavernae]
MVELLLSTRAALETDGHDYGPLSVIAKLSRQGFAPPSRATVARIFTRAGVVIPEPRKKPRSAYQRFVYPQPNACWQIDATEWPLANGKKVVIFQLLDDHSRLALASLVATGETSEAAIAIVTLALERHGVPEKFLSDNGAALNPSRRGRTGALVEFLKAHGVEPITGRPGKPTAQGKNERFHSTLHQYLRKQPPAASMALLQAQVDTFDRYYNTEREHQALPGGRTPQEAWDATPKHRHQPGRTRPSPSRHNAKASNGASPKAGLFAIPILGAAVVAAGVLLIAGWIINPPQFSMPRIDDAPRLVDTRSSNPGGSGGGSSVPVPASEFPAVHVPGDIFVSYPSSSVWSAGANTGYQAASPGPSVFSSPASRQGAQSSNNPGDADPGPALAAQNAIMHAASEEATRTLGKEGLSTAAAAHSTILGQNMGAAGTSRPAETAAHHIVAWNAKRAASGRDVLSTFGIGIDDAVNGVFLPRSSKSSNPTGAAVHSRIHTKDYYEQVNDLLQGASSTDEVIDALDYVRSRLLSGGFP